jgi:hypothetical protein
LKRIIQIAAVVVALILFVCLGAEFALNLRAARQAQSLLEKIRNLTVGESTEAEVQNLVDKNWGEAGGRISGVCELDAKHAARQRHVAYSRLLRVREVRRSLRHPLLSERWVGPLLYSDRDPPHACPRTVARVALKVAREERQPSTPLAGSRSGTNCIHEHVGG